MAGRSSRSLAEGLKKARLRRMPHKVETMCGQVPEGSDLTWSQLFDRMNRWAHERCGGPEDFTTATRRTPSGSMNGVIAYHFEDAGNAVAFREHFKAYLLEEEAGRE